MLVYFQLDRGITTGAPGTMIDGYYKAAYNGSATRITAFENRQNVMNRAVSSTGDSPNAASFGNFPVLTQRPDGVWTSTLAMVIDRQELGDDTDSDGNGAGDGTFGEMWEDKGATKNWQARFDTTSFTDGPLIVHYVIMDEAGNATHYQENIYVGNNAPLIRNITLGTNLDGGGTTMLKAPAIAVGNTPEGNREITTSFRIRNSRFSIDLNALYGNGVKRYRISAVTRNAATVNSTAMARGTVYTIANPGNTNWISYGALNNSAGTTFVSSGPARLTTDGGDDTTGTAYAYTTRPNAGTEVSGNFAANDNFTEPTEVIPGKNPTGRVDFVNNILFNNFTNIPDSAAVDNPTEEQRADPPLQRDRLFIIKVYDTTQTGGEENQLAHVALINVDVSNTDTLKPVINFAPFGQEYVLRAPANDNDNPIWAKNADRELGSVPAYTRNVVTTENDGTGTKKGYVQYETHANPDSTGGTPPGDGGRANVSGMVIFKGKAADNNRIYRIAAVIPNYDGGNGAGAEFDIATWNGAALAATDPAMTINAMRPLASANDRGFEMENHNLTLDYNHVVNWSFAWDTSTVSTVVANRVEITFRVYDARDNEAGMTETTTRVNIVPYIAEVITPLTMANSANPSAFNRSANGWYPVREDDTILLRGFNFNGANTGITVNGAALNGIAVPASGAEINGVEIPALGSAQLIGRKYLTARVDNNGTDGDANTITSGALVATVGTNPAVTSVNNRNNDTATYGSVTITNPKPEDYYNREPNGLNNNILKDDRYLYVWNTGVMINNDGISNPIMRMDNNANRYITFGSFIQTSAAGGTGNSQVKLIKNNDGLAANTATPQGNPNPNGPPSAAEQAGVGSVVFFNNRFLNNGLGITPQGEWAVVSSNMTSTGGTWTFVYNNWGQGTVNARSDQAAQDTYARRLLVTLGEDHNRIKYPRIVMQRNVEGTTPVQGTPARVILAYHDTRNATGSNQPITLNYGYFYGGQTSITNPAPTANAAGYVSGNFTGVNTGSTASSPATAQRVADNATGTRARSGQYVAAGLLNDGRPVVAWYDAYRQSLWYSYGVSPGNRNSTTVPTQTMANWQANAVEIKTYAGTHVDMAVDANNNVHLAYVDARNGGLWYTLITNATAPNTSPTTGNVKTVRVDTYLSTGTKLMLNLRREGTRDVPYITYIHNAFAETKNSVRVAWRKDFTTPATPLHGTNEDHTFTGNWEVMTVPAGEIPNTQEYVSNGVPTAATNWTAPNGSTLRTPGAGINNSILVGYMTDRWYEGAVLKHSITGN
jgi:hypothetical protein